LDYHARRNDLAPEKSESWVSTGVATYRFLPDSAIAEDSCSKAVALFSKVFAAH
jgi:hypothetical protein